MNISVAMAYINRLPQLRYTLSTFELFKFDGEVVICDDFSASAEDPRSLISEFPSLNIRVVTPPRKAQNPCVAYNTALSACTGDAVIIQNPECCWVGDIAAACRARLRDSVYLAFGCLSIPKGQTDLLHAGEVAADHTSGKWYNHSVYRPTAYHFCTAVLRRDLNRYLGGGFDERFAEGCDFDDDEFVYRVRAAGFGVEFLDSPYVIHQWHPKSWLGALGALYTSGHARNKALLAEVQATFSTLSYAGKLPKPKRSIAVFGSCRVDSLSSSLFETTAARSAGGGVAQPAIYMAADSEGLGVVTTSPSGYGVSPPEFLDLIRVARGALRPVDIKEYPLAYQEVHKFLKHALRADLVFDTAVLEVCSLNYIPNNDVFASLCGWSGMTIPYKIMYHEPASIGVDPERTHVRMSRDDLEATMQQILDAVGVPPSKLYVIGTYWFSELSDGSVMDEPVRQARAKINDDVAYVAERLGFGFVSMQDVLGGDEAAVAACLSDSFHLNDAGRLRVSEYIYSLIRRVNV